MRNYIFVIGNKLYISYYWVIVIHTLEKKMYRKETQIPGRITNEMHLVLKFISLSSEGQI